MVTGIITHYIPNDICFKTAFIFNYKHDNGKLSLCNFDTPNSDFIKEVFKEKRNSDSFARVNSLRQKFVHYV